MLNGEGNENGIKINKSNQQKNKFARAARFFLSLSLFCTTTTTKAGLFPPHPFFKGKALGTRLTVRETHLQANSSE